MMKIVKTRIFVQIVVVIVVIIMAYFAKKYTSNTEKELKNKGRFTIGTVTGWGKNFRSSEYFIKYNYSINGVIYNKSMTINSLKGIITSGGEYIVLYLPRKPKVSRVLIDKPVIFHPLGADTGWSEIPNFILHYKKDSDLKAEY